MKMWTREQFDQFIAVVDDPLYKCLFTLMLIHYGANFAVVADLISDTLEQVTKTYAHMYEEDKQAVLSKIF